jgi:acyl-CoA thioesterase I
VKTVFEMSDERRERFLRIAHEVPCTNSIRPQRFIKLLDTNNGLVSGLHRFGLDEHGLERRNPLIVALGDSVTAGQFEGLFNFGDMADLWQRVQSGEPLQIYDLHQVYHEQFRMLLADKYGDTCLSVINAGIGGDNMRSMLRRVYRDVVRHQPDLAIVAGTLNWSPALGTLDDFRDALAGVVQAIKANTEADIILLTPNAISDVLQDDLLPERVEIVRAVAEAERVSLVDAYKLWCELTTDQAELRECLANHINHPTAAGHRVYALALMQLFE